MHVPIDSSTHYPAFQTVGLHCQTPTLTHCVPCREAVCTIFMMVFGMTRPGGELMTYRVRKINCYRYSYHITWITINGRKEWKFINNKIYEPPPGIIASLVSESPILALDAENITQTTRNGYLQGTELGTGLYILKRPTHLNMHRKKGYLTTSLPGTYTSSCIRA